MGFRFRKSIKLPLGMRLNVSKNGVGFSYGVKGFRKSYSPTGQVRTTYSIPGTGLSYTKTESRSKDKESHLYGLRIDGNLHYIRTNSHNEAVWDSISAPHTWKTAQGVVNAKIRIAAQEGRHRGQDIEVVEFFDYEP